MYNDVITLFTMYEDTEGVNRWKKHEIYGTDLHCDEAKLRQTYGEGSQDRARLHVKTKLVNGEIYIGDELYVPPKEYNGAEGTITIRSGQRFDFFKKGTWDDDDIDDDSYTEGFYNFLKFFLDDVYAVSTVAFYDLIPHVEVLAR